MQELRTVISSANIFLNGAEIIRKGSVTLQAGKQTLRVLGMSASGNQDSARLYAKEGVSCYNIRFEIEDKNEEKDKIQEEIDDLNKQVEVKLLQTSLWQNNGDFSNRTNLNPNEIEDYIEKLPNHLEKLNNEIKELNKKIKELEEKLEEAASKDSLPIMYVDVDTKEAGDYNFELRYHEKNARWVAVYEVHSDGKEDVELKMRARVNEWTYEDWKDIAVSLFTGNPSSSGSLPVIKPIYVSAQEKVATKRFNNNMMMGASMMRMAEAVAPAMAMDMEDAMVRMETPEAIVNEDETTSEYVLSGQRDIFKDDSGTMVDLQNYKLKADYKIITIPRLDPNAYLVASIKREDLPINNSVNANIYLKDMFTGKINLNPDFSEENIDITLGKEERIHVTYKEVSKKYSNVLLKGQKVIDYVYETSINNNSDNEVELLYKNQIPVSNDKDVVVQTVELDGAKLDEETGYLNKEIKLAPKGNEKIKFAYKVAYPKDKVLKETATTKKRYCKSCGAEVFGQFCPECGTPYNN